MTFTLENCEGELDAVTGGIRLRGNSTMGYPKKPYRIKFDKKQSLFGLEKAKSWVLLAEYLDPSALHNSTAFYLANGMPGMGFNPTPNKVNVYLNGEYMGLYTLCEQVQENEGRIGNELDEITEDLVDLKDYNFFIAMDLSCTADAGAAEDETYIKIPIPYYGEELKRDYMIIELKYPEKDAFATEEQFISYREQLREYMTNLLDALYSGDKEYLEAELNINSLIDYLLVDQIMDEDDHHFKSFNMYFTNTSDNPAENGKLSFGPVWDYDYSLGVPWQGVPNLHFTVSDRMYFSNIFFWGMMNVPEFREIVIERYETYMRPLVLTYLENFDKIADSMDESVALNQELWYNDPNKIGGQINDEYRAMYREIGDQLSIRNIDFLKRSLEHRIEVLDAAWLGTEPDDPIVEAEIDARFLEEYGQRVFCIDNKATVIPVADGTVANGEYSLKVETTMDEYGKFNASTGGTWAVRWVNYYVSYDDECLYLAAELYDPDHVPFGTFTSNMRRADQFCFCVGGMKNMADPEGIASTIAFRFFDGNTAGSGVEGEDYFECQDNEVDFFGQYVSGAYYDLTNATKARKVDHNDTTGVTTYEIAINWDFLKGVWPFHDDLQYKYLTFGAVIQDSSNELCPGESYGHRTGIRNWGITGAVAEEVYSALAEKYVSAAFFGQQGEKTIPNMLYLGTREEYEEFRDELLNPTPVVPDVPETDEPETGDPDPEEPGIDPGPDANTPLPNLNLNGKVFTVLGRDAANWSHFDNFEIVSDGLSEDIVSRAVYERNTMLEEKYNFTIQQLLADNTSEVARISYESGDDLYDLVLYQPSYVVQHAQNGYLLDLAKMPYVNLNNSSWSQTVNEQLAINGKLYYTTNDFLLLDKQRTFFLLYNRDIAAELNLGYFEDFVDNNTWTLDKATMLARQASRDFDNNGPTNSDRFGFVMESNSQFAFVAMGAGLRLTKKNNEGSLQLAGAGQDMTKIIDATLALTADENISWCMQSKDVEVNDENHPEIIFLDNRALMISMTPQFIEYQYKLRNSTMDLGILPHPKYSSSQENYHSYPDLNFGSVLAIPYVISDEDITGFCLEAITEASTDSTYSALITKNCDIYDVIDADRVRMLELCFENPVYDIGAMLFNGTDELFTQMAYSIQDTGVNLYERIFSECQSQAQEELDELMTDYNRYS